MLLGPLRGKEKEGVVTGVVLTHDLFQTAEHVQRASRLPRGADGNTPVRSEMGHTACTVLLVLNPSVQERTVISPGGNNEKASLLGKI